MRPSPEPPDRVRVNPRPDLHALYARALLQRAEVQPCRDREVLEGVGSFLLGLPDLTETFTVFPFHAAVREPGPGGRTRLGGLIRAVEMLETLCVNLVLQPWKREIRVLKTFTGPYVYCLLPVLSASTIQSVLASIGYLPHGDAPQSEFRLSAEASADGALRMGFELLVARLECYRLLEVLTKDHVGPQEWLELLHRREQPTQLLENTEKKPTKAPKKGPEEEEEEEDDRNKGPHCLETKLLSGSHPKPGGPVDQSIMEMQRTYPDLAFRGRPLLADPDQDPDQDQDQDPDLDQDPDPDRVDEELSGPQAFSLHLTLKAGTKAEPELSLRGGRPGPNTETPSGTQTLSGRLPEDSCADEEQDLRELAARMEQLSVQGNPGEANAAFTGRKSNHRRSFRRPEMEPDPAGSQESSGCPGTRDGDG